MPNHTFWISFLNALLSYIIIKVLLNPREDILKYSGEIKKYVLRLSPVPGNKVQDFLIWLYKTQL